MRNETARSFVVYVQQYISPDYTVVKQDCMAWKTLTCRMQKVKIYLPTWAQLFEARLVLILKIYRVNAVLTFNRALVKWI